MEHAGTTKSYYGWGVEQIAADIKESVSRVSESPFDPAENASIPNVSYEVHPSAASCSLPKRVVRAESINEY